MTTPREINHQSIRKFAARFADHLGMLIREQGEELLRQEFDRTLTIAELQEKLLGPALERMGQAPAINWETVAKSMEQAEAGNLLTHEEVVDALTSDVLAGSS